eukprot:scaffold23747_cov103-Skeletonema_dohrnii-CCMP3373.AAC.2
MSSLRVALARSRLTHQEEQQQQQIPNVWNPNLMDAIDEDRPQSRLSSAASRVSSAVSRAGTALSRATTAVTAIIRAATPFRDVFVQCKRRRGITTTAIINAPRPPPHVISASPHIPVHNMPRVF